MSVKLSLSLLAVVAVVAHTASILDFLDFEDGKKLLEIPELRNDQPNRNCMCKGPSCACCVHFNITFVDLGGPGCVHMKYASPEEGFAVNVSYGKNLLHSSKIQGANPAPICLEVFGKFAQLCAKFNDLAPTADGLRGCLELDPKLLGESQLEFPLGCFRSTANGMEMEEPPAEPETTTEEEEETSTDDKDGFDAETFLLGIYQTAEQGVAFLSSLLDIPNNTNSTKPVTSDVTTLKPDEPSENSQRRAPKNIKHPNLL